ncbi:MAG: hypothetical protein ACLFR0_04590 [Alphaproteobacteria bacterium]
MAFKRLKDAAIHSGFTGALWGATAGFLTTSPLVALFTASAIGGYEFYQQAKSVNSNDHTP